MDIKQIGVVGMGLMGSGIVESCARAGFEVIGREVNDELLERGMNSLKASMERGVKKGKLTQADMDAALARVKGATSLADFTSCDLVIEAAVENMALKKTIFTELDVITRPEAILASNTSSLSITEIASATGRPDKVVVAHVPLMTFAILYSAIDNGFMAEQGIQVELQRVASGTQAVGFLAQGQVDVGAIGLAGGIFNAFNRGFDMRIVANASVWGARHDVMILGQAEKVKSGELKSVADLRGKRVGIAGGTGSAGSYLVDAALRTVGLTIKDVQVVSIANADVPIALKNKALDAGLAGVPFATLAVT